MRYRQTLIALALCLAGITLSGCSGSQSSYAPPPQQLAPPTYAVEAPPTEPSAPGTADEYYLVARQNGKWKTPKPGSKTRTKLMNAARKHLNLRCKFYVHKLKVNQEVAYGRIEPYPKGTGTIRNVTWVKWRKKWRVVTGNSTDEWAVLSPSAGSGSSLYYGDANGDGDSGVLYPSVPAGANPSDDWTGQNTEWHWVSGYYRGDGTYVSGHYRRTE